MDWAPTPPSPRAVRQSGTDPGTMAMLGHVEYRELFWSRPLNSLNLTSGHWRLSRLSPEFRYLVPIEGPHIEAPRPNTNNCRLAGPLLLQDPAEQTEAGPVER